MFSIQNYAIAIGLCFLAMVCWGSWQNTRNVAGLNWRFELFYWDFVSGILLLSLIMAFTFGSFGNDGRSFIADVRQADLSNIGYAMLGGAVWNIGTLLLTAGIAIAGMSVAFPIGGGIGWILGIVVLYIANPQGNPYFLFGGSAIVVVAVLLSMMSYKQLAAQQKKPTVAGIVISLLAGVAIAFFYRFVDQSLARDFTPEYSGYLTPYTAVVFFSLGAFISTFIYNPFFMRKPVEGSPVRFSDYMKGTFKQHFMGFLGGAIWCLGMSVSFMANKAASPAIAYGLSNAAPVVAALWGILVWREFKGAPRKTNRLLYAMFSAYLVGLVAIVYARIA
jgi:glucose uptake protein